MADEDRDPNISRRYRELVAEEPPPRIDDAILAAARREARARPSVLGPWAPAARVRWHVPVAAAAVVVLAAAVTLHLQVEQTDVESTVPAARQPAPAASAPEPEVPLRLKTEDQLKAASGEAAGLRAREPAEPAQRKTFVPDPVPAAAPAPAAPPAPALRSDIATGPASSVAGTIARQTEDRTARDAAAAERAPQLGAVQALAKRAEAEANLQAPARAPVPASAAAATPERELERIAGLRREGKHEDADKALAEFRKRHPEYRIPEAMRARVERR